MYKDSIASTSTYTKMNVKTYMHLPYISVSFSILRYTSTHYIIDSMGLIILLQCIIHIHHPRDPESYNFCESIWT